MKPNDEKMPQPFVTNPPAAPEPAPPLIPSVDPKYGAEQAAQVDRMVRQSIEMNPHNRKRG